MTQRRFRLAHISDLHFGKTEPPVVAALIDHINALPCDAVVASGDITQTARPSEFAEARTFFDAIDAPTLVVPGNHDLPGWRVWSRFLGRFQHYRSHINKNLDVSLSLDGGSLVGLNSARVVVGHWDWSNGALSKPQLSFAREQLEAVSDPVVRVVTLHHPIVPPIHRPGQKLVSRSREAAQVFAEGRADVILTGHLHVPQIRLLQDHHTGLAWNTPVVQTATSTSTRLRDHPNGFFFIEWNGVSMTAQNQSWDGHRFIPGERSSFTCEAPSGWIADASS